MSPVEAQWLDRCQQPAANNDKKQKPSNPDPAIDIHQLQEQLEESRAERNSLFDQVNRSRQDADQAQIAISDRNRRIQKLQQVIIENSQNVAPPMDDEIVNLFNQLNQEIMKIVKKHFTRPIRMAFVASDSPEWKELKLLSPENRELWVRAFIADDLYDEFFRKDPRKFGFDAKREEVLRDFESALAESGKGQSSFPQSSARVWNVFIAVSEADIVDWRIRTISCGQKLGLASPARLFQELAYETIRGLRPVGPQSEKDAEKAMAAIYKIALDIAILFRSNTVSYSWLQGKSPSSIQRAEREIIGSTNPGQPADKCRPWRIVFGGVVKNQNSEEDRVVLTKSELLVVWSHIERRYWNMTPQSNSLHPVLSL